MAIWKWLHQFINRANDEEQEKDMVPLSKILENNLNEIQKDLGNSPDIITRRFILGREHKVSAAIIFTDGLVSNNDINHFLSVLFTEYNDEDVSVSPIKTIKEQLLNIGDVKEAEKKTEILDEILTGSTALFIDGAKTALIASTKGWETSGVMPPENQVVLRGPREAFTTNIRTNTALIRRIITSSKLRLEQMKIGNLSETVIGIMYIEGVAHDKIVQEVRKRIKSIKIDGILGSGYMEDYITDNPWSLFPQVMYTERPDTAAGHLLEGKIIIIIDGTPFVLSVPVTYLMFFQSTDDYYLNWQLSTFLRLLRMFTFFISLTLPSLYVAITTFHQELLPTTLLVSLAAQREGVPFPAFIEALIMELTFEILREAGVRMPRAIGQAVSIVGALVLGTAAVEAGIVSPAMVITVSMTAISSFTAPYIEIVTSARILRFILLMLSASFGLFGMLFGVMGIVIHMTTLRSFGIPYLQGIAPFNITDQKDVFIRAPRFFMNSRPRLFAQKNPIRQDSNIPHPPEDRQRRKQDE